MKMPHLPFLFPSKGRRAEDLKDNPASLSAGEKVGDVVVPEEPEMWNNLQLLILAGIIQT